MERILIIEDDSAVRRALKRLFETEGYDVDLAGDGTAGLSKPTDSGDLFLFDDVTVSFSKMEVARHGEFVPFTAQEFKTLKFMLQNAERVLSRKELLTRVWGYQNYPTTRTVDNHILKLRQKLEREPSSPVHFLTVHSAGYKFAP